MSCLVLTRTLSPVLLSSNRGPGAVSGRRTVRRDAASSDPIAPPPDTATRPSSTAVFALVAAIGLREAGNRVMFLPCQRPRRTQRDEASGDRPTDTAEADRGVRLLRDGGRPRLRQCGRPDVRAGLRR